MVGKTSRRRRQQRRWRRRRRCFSLTTVSFLFLQHRLHPVVVVGFTDFDQFCFNFCHNSNIPLKNKLCLVFVRTVLVFRFSKWSTLSIGLVCGEKFFFGNLSFSFFDYLDLTLSCKQKKLLMSESTMFLIDVRPEEGLWLLCRAERGERERERKREINWERE